MRWAGVLVAVRAGWGRGHSYWPALAGGTLLALSLVVEGGHGVRTPRVCRTTADENSPRRAQTPRTFCGDAKDMRKQIWDISTMLGMCRSVPKPDADDMFLLWGAEVLIVWVAL